MNFVHLQCQSEYSVKNSLVRVPDLIDSVKEAGMKSVALTDDMSLFSAIKFYQKAIKSGINQSLGRKFPLIMMLESMMQFYFVKTMKDI